ncbi:MAG TPA: farnesyl diphosphate synthase [Pyrinomonadaceae bacterium]|nr:farnesyl diphosphate synthase [Pyrinomonadaceae bacterium]
MPELEDFFAEVTSLVDAELERMVPASGGRPQSLRDAIRWSLFAGGKHFRPALVFAVGRAFGAPDDKLVRTASAIEMLHTYSLIHDDLPSMDDDDLRRGRETCHRKFGEATAILAGDALQALSFQVISEDDRLAVDTRIRLISKLAQAAAKMVVGQQLDLEAEGTVGSLEDIENIHRHKTGALIRFSAEAGAIIGGAGGAEKKAVLSFGEKLGLLFQMKDDLLDVTKTTEELGKTAGKDAAAAKATYPAIGGIERTEILARQVHAEAKDVIAALGNRSELLQQVADFLLNRNA